MPYIGADLAQYVEPDPHHPGPGDARLRPSRIAVWAIVGEYLTSGDVGQVAQAYDVSVEEVQAALRYYREQKAAIDARLAANVA